MRRQYPRSPNAPLVQIEVICVPSQRNQSFLWLWEETKHEHTSPRGLKEGPGEAVQSQSQHQICPTSAPILSLHIKPHPLSLSLSSTLSISLSEGITRALKRGWLELDATDKPLENWVCIDPSGDLRLTPCSNCRLDNKTLSAMLTCKGVKGTWNKNL